MRYSGYLVALVATSGCASVFGIDDPDPAPPPPSCVVGSFDPCATQNANGPLTFTADRTVNTNIDCNLVLFEPAAGSICVLYATDVHVSAALRVFGTRPLVIAASGSISVDGTIDVASSRMLGAGAAADDASCTAKRVAGADDAGSGGAAGGSFGTKGGAGGMGAGGNGVGGLAGDPVLATLPRGGCPGGGAGADFSRPGQGGGSVWLVAAISIEVASTGRVLAGGGGGEGGNRFSNGGNGVHGATGGGSGGFIRLAAPALTVRGVLVANGGGGGEGSDVNVVGGFANAGADALESVQPAIGGSGKSGPGGDGGSGAAGSAAASDGARAIGGMAGGGGGGGGAGLIVLHADVVDTTGATISPSPQ